MEDCLNTEAVMEYSRTYPAAVAGRGDYFHYDPQTKEATLVYTPDPQVAEPTVLRVPVMWHYPQGFTLQVETPGVPTPSLLTPRWHLKEWPPGPRAAVT